MRREHQTTFGLDFKKYGYDPSLYKGLKQAKVELIDGDLDIFGDGSAKVIFTPDHCSLLVRLPKIGPVVLAADVAHYRFNMEHRCVPTMNSSPEESRSSMERIDVNVRDEKAQLWLNHDIVQTATIAHAPSSFD